MSVLYWPVSIEYPPSLSVFKKKDIRWVKDFDVALDYCIM